MLVRPTPQRGDVLTGDMLAAMHSAAKGSTTNFSAAKGLVSNVGPEGVSVALEAKAEWKENCVKAVLWNPIGFISLYHEYPYGAGPATYYSSPMPAPVWGTVELYMSHECKSGPTLLQCRAPSSSGRSHVGILQEGAVPGDVPWVQYAGISPVIYYVNSIPAGHQLVAGSRLGGLRRKHYAQWDPAGPLIVIENIGWSAGDPILTGKAIVQITSSRTESGIYVATDGEPYFSGYFKVLWMRAWYSASAGGLGTPISVTPYPDTRRPDVIIRLPPYT